MLCGWIYLSGLAVYVAYKLLLKKNYDNKQGLWLTDVIHFRSAVEWTDQMLA